METIYFEERFYKLMDVGRGHIPEYAVLIEVLKAHTGKLTPDFIVKDTAYWDKKEEEVKYYPLRPGWKCVLILLAEGHIFTTLRDWSTTKEAYWRALRGETVKIEVLKDEDKGPGIHNLPRGI